MNKYLIVRFSSFGDIAQALPVATKIHELDPLAEIHWLTREDFGSLVKSSPCINRVWQLDKTQGFLGLHQMVTQLKEQQFTHLYDAHSNLRSLYVLVSLLLNNWQIKWIRRSKNRIQRLLLFCFRINLFEKPFRGMQSYLRPLKSWFSDIFMPPPLQLNLKTDSLPLPAGLQISRAIVLAPSANWELKRWPVEYWVQLIQQTPDCQFVVLGGPADHFCADIAQRGGSHAFNLAGKLNWEQSMSLISQARAIVSGDTGLMHFADIIGVPTIALIGPTAFGYPGRGTSLVLEANLECQPCSKDGNTRCRNSVYKKCLYEIKPEAVKAKLKQII